MIGVLHVESPKEPLRSKLGDNVNF